MISLRNIKKTYNDNIVLSDVSLDIKDGEIIALIGSSGCGKTTLLRIIAGFEAPEEGSVFIDNKIASTSDYSLEPHKRGLTMIFQDLALWPHMSVGEHLEYALQKTITSKNEIKTKTVEILSSVDLQHCINCYPASLSGGERQRLSLARSIATKVDYLLMDEPFSSLDAILKDNLINLFISIKDRYKSILYVTHDIKEAFKMADKIAVLENGIIQKNKAL